ncbi:MAG: hypothetical protein LBU73_07555 [Helicobacteraceae bacterium]|jgi:hypothetical protein|nr:hypothetical protein [Helicobacteraceae bacterium]
MSRDYAPHNAAQLNSFMKSLFNYVTQKSAEWATIGIGKFRIYIYGKIKMEYARLSRNRTVVAPSPYDGRGCTMPYSGYCASHDFVPPRFLRP